MATAASTKNQEVIHLSSASNQSKGTNRVPVPAKVPVLDSQLKDGALAQVTSVSELSDVQPSDWAFQALQSLVERYGCIEGCLDKTFRGNRALTRCEFGAGLYACLNSLAKRTEVLSPEELANVNRLQDEFAAEIVTLQGRVDRLEARTREIEDKQFSTTTKLSGEGSFSVAGGAGGYPGAGDPDATPAFLSNTGGTAGDDTQVVSSNRIRLKLSTRSVMHFALPSQRIV